MALLYSVVAIFWTNCVYILKELVEGAAKPRVDWGDEITVQEDSALSHSDSR